MAFPALVPCSASLSTHLPLVAAMGSLLAGLAGCYSNSLLQEPDVLPVGKVRGAVGAQGYIGQAIGAPELGLRVGVSENAEVRLKATMTGGDVGVNVEVHDDSRVRVMLMPAAKAYFDVVANEDGDSIFDEEPEKHHDMYAASLPVITAVHLGDVDLFAGPDIQGGLRGEHGFGALGGHFGFALPLASHVHFVPEMSMLWTFAGEERLSYGPPRVQDRQLPGPRRRRFPARSRLYLRRQVCATQAID